MLYVAKRIGLNILLKKKKKWRKANVSKISEKIASVKSSFILSESEANSLKLLQSMLESSWEKLKNFKWKPWYDCFLSHVAFAFFFFFGFRISTFNIFFHIVLHFELAIKINLSYCFFVLVKKFKKITLWNLQDTLCFENFFVINRT